MGGGRTVCGFPAGIVYSVSVSQHSAGLPSCFRVETLFGRSLIVIIFTAAAPQGKAAFQRRKAVFENRKPAFPLRSHLQAVLFTRG